MEIMLNKDWSLFLKEELESPRFEKIIHFIETEIDSGKIIYPDLNNLFVAFNLCNLSNLKVVILGQDPYHNEGQANGLAFSIPKDMKLPPSLRNIFKELKNDLGFENSSNGDLSSWAKQGVLLLNTSLTVEKNKANSHKKIGWQQFTDAVIEKISEMKEGIIFVLWGNEALKKEGLLDKEKHFIIKSAHPSPLSVYNGFWDSHPFSKINTILKLQHQLPIEWEIK